MPPHFNKITIVGVGLLGGSIAMAIKKNGLSRQVCGFFRDPRKIAGARRRGIVDMGTDSFQEAVADADLIILCSPVGDIKVRLRQLKGLGVTKTLVTDIGSTKREIVEAARGLNFVGSHPLAGSEQSTAAFANPELLKKSVCVITTDGAHKQSLDTLRRFWMHLGSRVILMKAQNHDRALGFTSHLPHAVAYALIAAVPEHWKPLAAGGLKDTTRIALSRPELWKDIFLSNRADLLTSLGVFEKNLKQLQNAIAAKNGTSLLNILKKSREKRKRFSV